MVNRHLTEFYFEFFAGKRMERRVKHFKYCNTIIYDGMGKGMGFSMLGYGLGFKFRYGLGHRFRYGLRLTVWLRTGLWVGCG